MPVPDNPTIKIAFTGLLVFSPDDQKKDCQVGVLQGIEGHFLRFNVFQVTPTSKKLLLSLKGEDLHDDIILDINRGAGKPQGVELYRKGPFTRDQSDDPQDIRWTIHMEDEDFQGRKLAIKPERVSPGFHFNDGLLYSAFLSPATVQKGDDINETFVNAFVAANIYLDADSQAVLKFGPDAGQSLALDLSENKTYKIQVFNDCVQPVCKEENGDFTFYYKALTNEDLTEIKDPVAVTGPLVITGLTLPAGASVIPATREHPCAPIFG